MRRFAARLLKTTLARIGSADPGQLVFHHHQ
jgi:hypothetical protein